MLTAKGFRGAARALYRVGMGLGSIAVVATLGRVGLWLPKAMLVGVYGIGLVAFVAIDLVRPSRLLDRLVVVAAVVGCLGGLTLLVASQVLNVGGVAVGLIGSALLPIGGAAAGAVAASERAGATVFRTRRRQVWIGPALLIAGILVVVGLPAVDWLTMVSWGLPVLVLGAGALISMARTVERKP
jgi:hypothetical protein